MPEDPLITVIVPAHNTEQYLRQCLDSVLGQTYRAFEVLCFDDGSTDATARILSDYAEVDPRVKVLSAATSVGPGAARNRAIEAATGSLIAFVDSDDHVDTSMLEKLHASISANDSDIAMAAISKFSERSDERFAVCSYLKVIPERLDGERFAWSDLGTDLLRLRFVCWNKLYRTDFLKRNKIVFSEGIFYEDLIFFLNAMLKARRISFVREELYFNRRHREGATTHGQGERAYGALRAFEEAETIIMSERLDEEFVASFQAFRFKKLHAYLVRNDPDIIENYYAQVQEISRALPEAAAQTLPSKLYEEWRRVSELDFVPYLTQSLGSATAENAANLRKIRELRARLKTEQSSRTQPHAPRASDLGSMATNGQDEVSATQTGERNHGGIANRRLGIRSALKNVVMRVPVLRVMVRVGRKMVRKPNVSPSQAVTAANFLERRPPKYRRDSKANLYDGVDLLRERVVQQEHELARQRIRRRVRDGQDRIRVSFIVNSSAHWNATSLAAELAGRGPFDVGLVQVSPPHRLAVQELTQLHDAEARFFEGLGYPVTSLYDRTTGQNRPIEDVEADVVFFQMPWGAVDFPRRLLGKALSTYIHYGFMMMANHEMHYDVASFHSYVWRFFAQTDHHRSLHVQHDPTAHRRIVVTGYPKLDPYGETVDEDVARRTWADAGGARPGAKQVLYAPHHSLGKDSLAMSTFRWSGQAVNELASVYPENSWLLKPHPKLQFSVRTNDFMTKEEYEEYESQWSKRDNSTVYALGEYFDIFRSSDLMITCCGSFPAEYLPTGKPIIWLRSANTVGFNEIGEKLVNGFYVAEDPQQLSSLVQQLLVEGFDPLRERRLDLATELFPKGQLAAAAVVDHLEQELLR